ncbi:MAG: hypothetical protein RIS79_368, partial [Verrucomicrobiota bacterium]
MSRHARQDLDLSALPTVADVEDDDLIDRDDKWHEFQRSRQVVEVPAPVIPETAPESEPARQAPAPEMEMVHEPDPEPEALIVEEAPPPPSVEIRLIDIQPPRALEKFEVPEDEALDEVIPAPKPAPPAKTKSRESKTRVETLPVSFGEKETEPTNKVEAVQPPKPEIEPEEPLTSEEKRRRWWEDWKVKIGASSLGVSVGIHALILIIGALITVRHVMDKQVDFLPGGSPQGKAASEALEHKVRQKKSPWLKNKPMSRVTVQSITADVQLPEMDMDSLNLSGMT